MRALVVVESMFGNTRHVASAIAEGLSSAFTVDVLDVGMAPTTVESDVDLLVVGGPTHAFSMSRESTRTSAVQQGAHDVSSRGIREWLELLERDARHTPAAAFDTRIKKPLVPGSAARAAQRRLRRLGFRLVVPAESFGVMGTSGPLGPGELDRAREWGRTLAGRFAITSKEQRSRFADPAGDAGG